MTATLLLTKLTPPPVREHLIPRTRLVERLARGATAPLTVVSAPAGFGKTTAAVVAAHHLQQTGSLRVAWLTLHETDDDPLRFWRYVGASLQRAGMVENPLVSGLDTPQPPPLPVLLTALLNELATAPAPLVLVLDDYHLIEQPEIHAQVAQLVEAAPPTFHLWLVTRADPPLPLHRLRARGLLLELRSADLRFTAPEAVALLTENLALPLDPAEAARLAERTEGWAAGLHLAALALQGEADPGALLERLLHSDQFILDYLAEEVLNQQPPHLQLFLMQTAILPALCAELCAAVTTSQDAQADLETVIAKNLFLTPVEAPHPGAGGLRWVRYHRLFADLLRGHLQRRLPDQVPLLHRRAAAWFAAHSAPDLAIEHALAGEDFPLAARLLDENARHTVMQGQVRTVERWLARLPAEWRTRLPRATLAFAWALLLRGQYAAMMPYLERAADLLPDFPALQGEYHTLRASLADTLGQAEQALVHAHSALGHIAADDLFTQAAAQMALAGAQRELGNVVEAIAAYDRAIALCHAARLPVPEMLARAHACFLAIIAGQLRRAEAFTRPVVASGNRHPLAANVRGSLALVLIEADRLDEAAQVLQEALAGARASGHNATLVNLQVARARLARARGDHAAARPALEEAAPLLELGAPAWLHTLLLVERVHALLDAGAGTEAAHLLDVAPPAPANHLRDAMILARARVEIHQGTADSLQRAAQRLETLDAGAASGGRHGTRIAAAVLTAALHARRGDDLRAQAALNLALDLAQPEGYVRTILDGGAAVVDLLARSSHPYAHTLLRAGYSVSPDSAGENGLAEPLTARELEVLQGMARGLSYQQIADTLIVSINTVRHHVKSLYAKLQVNKATHAVERAQRLGLL